LKSNTHISFSLLTLGLFLFHSCNSTKYVPKGDYLLTENRIFETKKAKKSEETTVQKKTIHNTEVTDLIIQRPNQKSLGLPLPLYFYNLGNLDYENAYKKKKEKNPKYFKFLAAVFSEKQVRKKEENYKARNKWFLSKGEAPVVHDINKTIASAKKIRTYYFNQGYFDALVKKEVTLNFKKSSVHYYVEKMKPYHLGNIQASIESTTIDSIFKKNTKASFLKKGDRYIDQNFRKEAKRLTTLFRNSGIYHFTENLIGFYNIDTLSNNHKTDVLLKITDRLSEKEGQLMSHPLQIQTLKNIKIYTDYSYQKKGQVYQDSATYNGFQFYAHDKIKYRPKTLLNSVFLEPHQIYQDSTRNLTRNHLKSLKNFKLVKLKYKELNSDELSASILLTPLKKYSIRLNTEAIHSNIKQLGFSGGFSFLNRNTFKGAEIFKLSFQGSIFDISNNTGSDDTPFNSWEVGTDASLEIPRFVFPFLKNKIIPKNMGPKTVFSVGTSFQKNIGLDKQKFTGIIKLSWKSNPRKTHSIEMLNAQFVKNLNTNSYFSIYSSEFDKLKTIQEEHFPNNTLSTSNALTFVSNEINTAFQNNHPEDYQTAKNIQKRYDILTLNNLSPSISYAFTYNTQFDFKDNDYFLFKAKVATSGNIASMLAKKENDGVKTFLDIPIAQFTRADVEFKKFWKTKSASVFAFRSFLGVAVPYGNSDEIPFSNSYFIGGSSDIRAWKTYDLGPGSSNTGLEFNVSNFKFINSLEYRFDINRSFKGALFIDAGNIWDITNSDLTTVDEKFIGLKSLKNIAVGTGFGIRYDFNFLVLRLDLGFKTYEPYLEDDRWLQNYNFENAVLNIGINYPF
jgi:outer membrane protein assembly factor BamA